jgi:mono/diheme cytochrome c family protein
MNRLIHSPALAKCLSVLIAVGAFAIAQRAVAEDVNSSNDLARQLFDQHCQKCHTGSKHKGDFQIKSLSDDFADKANCG